MPRAPSPCGTWAAYKRHKRNKEEIDEACAHAARDYSAQQKKRQKILVPDEPSKDKKSETPETIEVSQLVAYGVTVDVEVPTVEDKLESARWRLHRIRAAMLVAGPRDVAPLAKAEADTVAEISEMQVEVKPKKRSALDELAAKRAERIARAAG